MSYFTSYEYDNMEDCLDEGMHLAETDEDGFCEFCGFNAEGSDDDWEPED